MVWALVQTSGGIGLALVCIGALSSFLGELRVSLDVFSFVVLDLP